MLLEGLLFILFFIGSALVGVGILAIGSYVWAIVKTNRERKEWNNRYYR